MDSSVVTAAKTDGQELNPQNAGDANLTGDQSPVFNPATGEIIAYVPNSSSEDVNSAVAAAKAAFETRPPLAFASSTRLSTIANCLGF